MNRYLQTFLSLLLLASSAAQAALTIEITQGVEGAVPIAIVPFGWDDQTTTVPENLSAIISADLNRSGHFAALPDRDLVAFPTQAEQVQFKNWRMVNVDYLTIGKISPAAGGQFEVQFQLFDVFNCQVGAGQGLLQAFQSIFGDRVLDFQQVLVGTVDAVVLGL